VAETPTEIGKLVDLVVPTFDRPETLAVAVESALSDTPFLVTVLDDLSPVHVSESLDVDALNRRFEGRLRVIRNVTNLGASLNILRALEVSRAPYTWSFADDHVVPQGAAREIADAITRDPEAAILYWNYGLDGGEELEIDGLEPFIEVIERGRAVFGFIDVHCNRVVKTDVGRKYLRFDARFSHAQPMLGLQIAALAGGYRMRMFGGGISRAQEDSKSGWSRGYLQRFKLDPAYLIPSGDLRNRYRSVVARDYQYRESLLDLPPSMSGSIDEAFALDAARLIAGSSIQLRLRAEARVALILRRAWASGWVTRLLPRKKRARAIEALEFKETTW
jgi:hypothetical protein